MFPLIAKFSDQQPHPFVTGKTLMHTALLYFYGLSSSPPSTDFERGGTEY